MGLRRLTYSKRALREKKRFIKYSIRNVTHTQSHMVITSVVYVVQHFAQLV
jgi:hypothetical protein